MISKLFGFGGNSGSSTSKEPGDQGNAAAAKNSHGGSGSSNEGKSS